MTPNCTFLATIIGNLTRKSGALFMVDFVSSAVAHRVGDSFLFSVSFCVPITV